MKSVWKYPLEVCDSNIIECPQGAIPLSVQMQAGNPCLWMLVETTSPAVKRRIHIRGTGHCVDDLLGDFIGTFQMFNGSFIGHVFDGTEE